MADIGIAGKVAQVPRIKRLMRPEKGHATLSLKIRFIRKLEPFFLTGTITPRENTYNFQALRPSEPFMLVRKY